MVACGRNRWMVFGIATDCFIWFRSAPGESRCFDGLGGKRGERQGARHGTLAGRARQSQERRKGCPARSAGGGGPAVDHSSFSKRVSGDCVGLSTGQLG